MDISDELIERLARLARLEFKGAEKAAIQEDLKKMLDFVQKLEEVDTKNVEPLLQINELYNKYRSDKAVKLNERSSLLEQAPTYEYDWLFGYANQWFLCFERQLGGFDDFA